MLMTHPSFASAGMASTSDTVRSSTVPTPSPNTPQSNSHSTATLGNGASAPSSNGTNGHSSSLSSLFERVTNFRRSLIKNQAKSKHKSATRPVSGTFSFFNGKALQEQNGSMAQNSVSSASLMLEQFSNRATPEDEIYGFTAGSTASLRLRMQRLNLSMGPQISPPLSSPSSLTPSSPPSQLYETIDETKKSVQQAPKTIMDPARPLPALPIEHSSQSKCSMSSPPIQSCSLNKSSPAKSTSYLRAKQNSNAMSNRHQNRYYTSGATSASLLQATCSINSSDDDWKRNRRSSAIIFGTDFSSDLVDPNDSIISVPNSQKQFAHLNRSSDDLLLASRSTSKTDHKGIYENLRSSRPKVNSGIREDRKLTKDSGYESASTLINVGMQNSNAIQKSQQNGFFVNKTNIQPHSRSDSIDSNNSLDLYQSVETRAFDSAFIVRTTDIDSVEDDSPPPTPPIRYSSLVQNRVQQCSRIPKQSQESTHSSHLSHSSHSHSHHQQHHQHHHQHLKQDSIVSLVSSGSGGSQASSHSSASNSLTSSSSLFMQTPNTVINNYNNHYHLHQQQQQQKHYSRNNVEYGPQQNSLSNEFICQPVNYRMVEVLPSSPPPPLPPKNCILISQTNNFPPNNKDNKDQPIVNDIKAIQKKAVYEFYLRQKEKKLKEKENSCLKLTPTSPMSTVDYSEKFELPPLPPPEIAKWSTEEEDEEFPPPPTPLDKSVEYLSSLTTESEIASPLLPPPPPLSASSSDRNSAQSQIYRGIDLSKIWPNIDFSPLLNLRPPVKESDLDIEDGDDVDEELAGIERAHKSQLEANWKQSQLEAIRLSAETEMNFNENQHEALFKLEQGAKLESLCADVTMISRLLVSIVGQLTVQNSSGNESDVLVDNVAGNCDGIVNAAQNDPISGDSIEVSSRRTRLLGQLEDAKRLRDNIDTRRTMFVARIERRSLPLSSTSCSSTDLTLFASADPLPATQSLGSQLADYLSTRERTLVLTEFVALLSNANTK